MIISEKRKKHNKLFEEAQKSLAIEKGEKMSFDLDKNCIEAVIRKAGKKQYEFYEFKLTATLDEIEVIDMAITEKFDSKLSENKATPPIQGKPQNIELKESSFVDELPTSDSATVEFDGSCKYCGMGMWDNTKPSPEFIQQYPNMKFIPKYKCKDKSCGGTYWPNFGSAKGPNWTRK